MIDKPGIYQIPNEEYHGNPAPQPCFSTGVCKDLLFATPLHAWTNHPALNPCFKEEKDEKFDIGAAAHPLYLEGKDMACVIDADDWRKNETKALRDQARVEGKVPLLRKQYADVMAMVEVAQQVFCLRGGQSEESFFWIEGETWCKIRPDWHDHNVLLHYKTTTQLANPETLHRLIISLGYDVAEALYRRGFKALTGGEPESLFLFQETSPPYQCSCVSLSPQWRAMADEKVKAGLSIWKKCMETGNWPGYSDHVYTLDPPSWALAQWEEKRFALELGNQEEEL